MRILTVLLLLCACVGAIIAQDAEPKQTPEQQLAKLEERLKKTEDETAELRREIEALKNDLAGNKPPEGVLWTLDMKSDTKGSGAIADLDGDGKPEVVFGSYFGEQNLFCVKGATGEVVWKHKSDAGPLDASVALADLNGDGKLEVFSADSSSGHFYDIAPDGTLNWKFKLPNSTDSPVAIADLDGDGTKEFVIGSMWEGNGEGAVTCYSADGHKQLWQQHYRGCIQSEPVLVDLNGDKVLDVIVTTWRGDNYVHAINGKDGSDLWKFLTKGDSKSMGMYHGVALSADEKSIFVSTCQGDVYCIDTEGKEKWHQHYDDYLFSPIAVADINGDKHEEVIFGGHKLYCLSARDGFELWQRDMEKLLDRGVVVTDVDGDNDMDVLYADHLNLVARDGKTGEETFRFDATVKGEIWEDISSAVLVADLDGDGLTEAFFINGQGTSTDEYKNNYGRAFAVHLKGKGPEWTTFRANLRRTGNPAHK